MSLKRKREFRDNFDSWFQSEIKPTIDSSRKRYRLEHADAEARDELGLSAIPSAKSTATIDRAVDKAIIEYHGEQDAISFTAKNSGKKDLDFLAAIHTENFNMRGDDEEYFPFAVWNATSLTAGLIDGVEAAMVTWKKESYIEKEKVYLTLSPEGMPVPVDEETYNQYKDISDYFIEEEVEKEVKTFDSWWIDQLFAGENLFWDTKAPLLNMNMGQVALVVVEKTVDEILSMAENGLIDKVSREDLAQYQDASNQDTSKDVTDPDMDEFNTIEMWYWFFKEDSQWYIEFSIEDKKSLGKKQNVNDIFFNGRKFNRLPIAMGTTKLQPFKRFGRGIPEVLKPIEDALESMDNLRLDAAKQNIEGRWRVNESSTIDINQLINSPVVYGNAGEFEKFDNNSNSMAALTESNALVGGINELAPVGMESSQIVPSGADKTLGAIQLALGSSNEKLSVSLMVRNFTFFKPLLRIISEMTIAYETDENLLRLAADKVGKKSQFQGMQLPNVQGQIDLNKLDIPLNIQINAGLGSVPRQQKIQMMQYVGQMGAQLGVPLDTLEMFKQGCVLLGFSEDQFISTEPQQPQGPELKGTINIDLDRLPPEMQMQVFQLFAQGSSELNAKFKGDGQIQMPDVPAPMQDPVMQGPMNAI